MLCAVALLLLAPVQGWVVASKINIQSKLPLTAALRAATDEKLGKQVSDSVSARLRCPPDSAGRGACIRGYLLEEEHAQRQTQSARPHHQHGAPISPRPQLERYDRYINSVTVSLKVESRSLHDTEHIGKESHIAELTALCTDKAVLRVSHECEDMYASIDLLADQLARKLKKHKEKLSDRKNDNLATSDLFVEEELDPDSDSVPAE